MINHTKKFYIKQKEREIQKKLRLEEKRMLKESAYKRRLKRLREKHKAMKKANGAEYQTYLEYHKMYYKKHPEKYKINYKNNPEKYKKYIEYQRIYREKCRLKKAKNREKCSLEKAKYMEMQKKLREERIIAFLDKRNWRKIKFEGQKYSHYVADDGHIYKENGKEIGSVNKNGYVVTSYGYIHRIIWETFNGKIPEGYEIDHINTIRNDNRLENLRLVTPKENCNNPLTIEHYKQSNKTKNYAYLKNIDRTHLIKYHNIVQMDLENNVIAKYKTIKDIPSKYSKRYIYRAIEGINKTACGYIWKANT